MARTTESTEWTLRSTSSTAPGMNLSLSLSKVGMGKGVLDLEKHFAQYGAYNNNPANIVIHTIFVWPILFTGLLLFYFTPPFLHLLPVIADVLPFTLRDVLCLNFGFFFALVYALYYVAFDVVAGSLGAALVAACWVGSSLVGNSLGFSLAWKVVGISQLVCWSGQFIGHGLFEKRAPALLDNLAQAFLMAPFFVLLEVLHKLFGYEPYPGFTARVSTKIESDIKEWKASKQKKSS